MEETFYDKVTRKFGSFQNVPKSIADYPQGNPEALFEQKLLELSAKDKVALDLGCGDGSFMLRLAQHFQEIVGIEISTERLKLAQAAQKQQGQNNVRFEKQDASHTSFPDQSFDLVYSRRGPSPYQECQRLLKAQGHFAMISIGEKDAWELKEIFGRGQGYHVWHTTALEQAIEQLQQAGFAVTYQQDVFFDEYYPLIEHLDLFLQRVPIFEDYDSEQDRAFLEAYVARAQTARGIHLPRQRYLVIGVRV